MGLREIISFYELPVDCRRYLRGRDLVPGNLRESSYLAVGRLHAEK